MKQIIKKVFTNSVILSGAKNLKPITPHPSPLLQGAREKRAAFTLAEVLITLGIIGVVAAIVLPNVVANYKKMIAMKKLKTTYSLVSQAIEKSKVDNGNMNGWSSLGHRKFVENYIEPYIKYVKIYHTESYKSAMCYEGKYPSKWYNGAQYAASYRGEYISTPMYWITSITLPNGVCVGFSNYSNNPASSALWPGYGQVYIDINGEAYPNIAGEDLFIFILMDNTIKPMGYNKEYDILRYNCDPKTLYPSGTGDGMLRGFYCAARVMADGWKINYKY